MFFEAPRTADAAVHLDRLLAVAWCTDTAGWCEDGAI